MNSINFLYHTIYGQAGPILVAKFGPPRPLLTWTEVFINSPVLYDTVMATVTEYVASPIDFKRLLLITCLSCLD